MCSRHNLSGTRQLGRVWLPMLAVTGALDVKRAGVLWARTTDLGPRAPGPDPG
jgi:hypothetical protein